MAALIDDSKIKVGVWQPQHDTEQPLPPSILLQGCHRGVLDLKNALRHMDTAVKDKDREMDAAMVAKNAAFILDTVLTLVEHKYQEQTKTECPKLNKLHSNYSWMKEGKLQKYADPNYV